MTAVALAAILLSGSGLCALASGREATGRWLPASVLAGAGLWSMMYAAALFAFGASIRVMMTKDAALIAAGAAALLLSRRRTTAPLATPAPAPAWCRRVLTVTVLVATALFVEHTIRFPDGGADAWAIWNLRARSLARAGESFRDAFSPELLFWAHQDYPLLLPGLVAQFFRITGTESFWVSAALAWAIAAAEVWLLWRTLANLRSGQWGILATLLLVSTPAFLTFAANQQADVPISAFLLLATSSLAVALEHGPRASLLLLSGAALSMCAWTKNEGLLYLGCTLLALVVARRTEALRARFHDALLVLAGALPGLLLLVVFKRSFAHENDLTPFVSPHDAVARAASLHGWWTLLVAWMRRFVYVQAWGFHLLATVAAVVYLGRRPHELPDSTRILAWTLGLALCGFAAMYLLQPYPLLWFFRASIDRVSIHLWPSALFATFLALASSASLNRQVENGRGRPGSP